mgnify:CR=1 FL=1
MIYRLDYSDGFTSTLDEHLTYLNEAGVSRFTIDRWFEKLLAFTESLSEWPERFPVDHVLTMATGRETRKANFGRYLISYRVNDDDRTVTLLGFVHGSMRRER